MYVSATEVHIRWHLASVISSLVLDLYSGKIICGSAPSVRDHLAASEAKCKCTFLSSPSMEGWFAHPPLSIYHRQLTPSMLPLPMTMRALPRPCNLNIVLPNESPLGEEGVKRSQTERNSFTACCPEYIVQTSSFEVLRVSLSRGCL